MDRKAGASSPGSPPASRSRVAAAWGARLIVGGVFLYAGAIKAWDPAQFQLEIERYRLVGPTLAWLSAAYLPYLEILAAAALFHRRSALAGRIVIGAMLIVFIAALAAAWMRGLNISCGCFGAAATTEKPNYAWWIIRDLILLAMLGWLHRADQRSGEIAPLNRDVRTIASQ